MLLIYNAHHDIVNFTLPAVAEGLNWTGLIDTNQPESQMPAFEFGHAYEVTGRSLLAFVLTADNVSSPNVRRSLDAVLEVSEMPLF
jgi:glycogen operon protein